MLPENRSVVSLSSFLLQLLEWTAKLSASFCFTMTDLLDRILTSDGWDLAIVDKETSICKHYNTVQNLHVYMIILKSYNLWVVYRLNITTLQVDPSL